MKVIEIKEETKIPQENGTTVVLEAGDKIEVLEKVPVELTEAKDALRFFDDPFVATMPNGDIGIGIKVDGETYHFRKHLAILFAQEMLDMANRI